MALVGWSKTLGNSKQKLEEKTKELEGLTALKNAANNEVIKKVKADINSLLFQDELFWQQQSRAIWLPAWDKNTKFFFTNELVNSAVKIALLVSLKIMDYGAHQKRPWLEWLKTILRTFLPPPIRETWDQFWMLWIG